MQTKYFWRFDNAPMFKAMWLTVKDPSTNLLTEALSTKKKKCYEIQKNILLYFNTNLSKWESLFFHNVFKKLTDCFTHQHCHVEFPFKFFDKMVDKKGLSKNYQPLTHSLSKEIWLKWYELKHDLKYLNDETLQIWRNLRYDFVNMSRLM